MIHILNCITDEKFIDNLIDVLDSSQDEMLNDYVLLSEKKMLTFKYIKNSNRIIILNQKELMPFLIKGNYIAVMLHSWSSLPTQVIINIPQSIKVFWFAWGFDIYTMPVYKPLIKIERMYHPLTKRFVKGSLMDQIRHYHAIIDSFINRKCLQKAIRRIDYFSGIIPEEYELIKSHDFFTAKRVEFSYFNLNSRISEDNIGDPYATNNNILIGNSGDCFNNHLDLFERLKGINITGNKIYSFLSYGGTKLYKDKVKFVANKYFRDNFIPLEHFLSYEEFCKIINSCGNVIMGHERQQAMGNIYTSLWNGCKIYVSETSILYQYMKNNGFNVYTIQKDLNEYNINTEMSFNAKLGNRKTLIKLQSPKVNMEKIHRIYEILEESIQ